MFRQFIKQTVVIGKARFIWLSFVPLRENTRPGNGDAQAAKAHFCKQRDILWITVVEINGDVFNAKITWFAFGDITKYAMRLNVGR